MAIILYVMAAICWGAMWFASIVAAVGIAAKKPHEIVGIPVIASFVAAAFSVALIIIGANQ